MRIEVRRATAGDVPHLAENLREADRQESEASTRGLIDTRMALLTEVLSSSQTLVITVDGIAEAIGGIRQDGQVWLLGTDLMTRRPLRPWLLRNSRRWINHLNAIYPVLHNRVDARNKAHVRWLKWCGFIFINRHLECGVEFLSFVRIPEPCAIPYQ